MSSKSTRPYAVLALAPSCITASRWVMPSPRCRQRADGPRLGVGNPIVLDDNHPFRAFRIPVTEIPTASQTGTTLLFLSRLAAGASALRRP